MSEGAAGKLAHLLRLAGALAGVGYVLLFVVVAFSRMSHPFELEWMEGGSLQHLSRVAKGLPLYVLPSIDFVPYPYPPLYYQVAHALTPLAGDGFAPLRLVSILASVATMALLFAFVRREGGRLGDGVVAAGLFAATFRASGAYMDVARLDALFVFLALLSAFLLRGARSRAGLLAAAGAAFLAAMTKQTEPLLLAALGLWCAVVDWERHGRVLRRWRLVPWFVLPSAAAILAGWALLDGVLDEHFALHVIWAQSQHGVQAFRFAQFFGPDLLYTLPVPIALSALYLALPAKDGASSRRGGDRPHLFVGLLLLGALVAALIPRVKVSGAANNLILPYACLSLAAGLALANAEVWLGRLRATRPRLGAAASPVLYLAVLAQLAMLLYDPRIALPSPRDDLAGRRLVEILSRADGEVLIPAQGYLAAMAGKPVYAHQMPVSDFAKSGLPQAAALRESYLSAIREQRFALIIDSTNSFLRRYPDAAVLERYYRRAGWALEDYDTLKPISGFGVQPGVVWVPRKDGEFEDSR